MLAGAALGLLALFLAFSFSLALSRFEGRRAMVLQEANAIGSAANFALMLPEAPRQQALALLRDYTTVRIGLGRPFSQAKLAQDVARSIELQTALWAIGVSATAAAPQALAVYRFVGGLNEMNNIHHAPTSRRAAVRPVPSFMKRWRACSRPSIARDKVGSRLDLVLGATRRGACAG